MNAPHFADEIAPHFYYSFWSLLFPSLCCAGNATLGPGLENFQKFSILSPGCFGPENSSGEFLKGFQGSCFGPQKSPEIKQNTSKTKRFGGIQTPKSGGPPSKHKVFKGFSQGEPSILGDFQVRFGIIWRFLGKISMSQRGRKTFRKKFR